MTRPWPKRFALMIGAVLLLSTYPAQAATLVGVEALRTWNMIIFGDVRSSSEVEGRSFIGGNLGGDRSGYYTGSGDRSLDPETKGGDSQGTLVNDTQEQGGFVTDSGKGDTVAGRTPGLTVVGNVEGGAKILANGAGAAIGGDLGAELRLEGSQTVDVGGSAGRQEPGEGEIRGELGKDFTETLQRQREELIASMTDLSTNLAALKPTGEIEGGDVLMIKAGEGVNVFNLSLEMFSQAKDISVSMADGSTIIVNISGSSGVLGAGFSGGSDFGRNIIWNFHDAADLVFNAGFMGTVLAPGALVDSRDFIQGTLVAAGLEQSGAMRMASFQGDLSASSGGANNGGIPVVSATPEPATWAMLMLGFGLIGAALRQRSQRAMALPVA